MTWHELTRGIVMPAHCDVYGHMNVRHYAAFFDDAGLAHVREGGRVVDRAAGAGTRQRRRIADDRLPPRVEGGAADVVTGAFTRVGEQELSATRCGCYESESMTHCATQKTVEVCFDTKPASPRRSQKTFARRFRGRWIVEGDATGEVPLGRASLRAGPARRAPAASANAWPAPTRTRSTADHHRSTGVLKTPGRTAGRSA